MSHFSLSQSKNYYCHDFALYIGTLTAKSVIYCNFYIFITLTIGESSSMQIFFLYTSFAVLLQLTSFGVYFEFISNNNCVTNCLFACLCLVWAKKSKKNQSEYCQILHILYRYLLNEASNLKKPNPSVFFFFV